VGTFLRFAGIPPTAAHVGSCGALLARCWVRLGTVFVTGIVLTGAVGLLGGSVGWIEWIGALGEGIAGTNTLKGGASGE